MTTTAPIVLAPTPKSTGGGGGGGGQRRLPAPVVSRYAEVLDISTDETEVTIRLSPGDPPIMANNETTVDFAVGGFVRVDFRAGGDVAVVGRLR